MSANSVRKRRANLMAQNPHCHWCGKELRYSPIADNGVIPEDYPTIDHINSRVGRPKRPRRGKRVLSCLACNQARARREWTLLRPSYGEGRRRKLARQEERRQREADILATMDPALLAALKGGAEQEKQR